MRLNDNRQQAGTQRVNPATGKVVKGGQFTMAEHAANPDAASSLAPGTDTDTARWLDEAVAAGRIDASARSRDAEDVLHEIATAERMNVRERWGQARKAGIPMPLAAEDIVVGDEVDMVAAATNGARRGGGFDFAEVIDVDMVSLDGAVVLTFDDGTECVLAEDSRVRVGALSADRCLSCGWIDNGSVEGYCDECSERLEDEAD